jgi:tRNA (guanine37-N1)-methyltransferase
MKTTIMSNSWSATVLTLFPEMFPGPLGISLLGKALANNLWSLDVRDIRDHGLGKHRTVDDTPAGGGPGMVMRADVAVAAIDAVERNDRPLIYLSPRGLPLTQGRVRELAAGPGAILLCGRFEGLDQRAIDARSIEEISIGDFVLAGGEIAAMALIEAAVRLIPGVLGDHA